MRERSKHIEDELERQYKMLADYDRLLGHTTDPIKREEYLHFSEIVRENIARLEQGLDALALPTSGDQPQNMPIANPVKATVQPVSSGEQAAMQVFICYSKVDDKAASELYERLQAAGYKPWRDEEDLLPGQDWKRENRRALEKSRVALVLLSQKANQTSGFNNALLKIAVEVADYQPPGTISLIPLRLDDCELHSELEDRNLKPLDYFKPNSFERLVTTLKAVQPPSAPSETAAPTPTQTTLTSHLAPSQDSAVPPDFASLVPELDGPNERFALAEELLKCEALSDRQKWRMVISMLPAEIRHNINDVSSPRLHVLEIVSTCDNYENGLAKLLEAVYRIEGNTKAWGALVTYLKSR